MTSDARDVSSVTFICTGCGQRVDVPRRSDQFDEPPMLACTCWRRTAGRWKRTMIKNVMRTGRE